MTNREKRRKTTIDGNFAWRLVEMLESPAYAALSLSGHRVLTRLEIELANHGGTDNGKLPCTFDDFQRFHMDRHAVAPAIREVVALGFVEITKAGRAGNADYRTPNIFRLTYRHTNHADPTNEWRKIKTLEGALLKAETARKDTDKHYRYSRNIGRTKNKTPVGETHTVPVGVNALSPVGETHTTAIPAKPTLLTISPVWRSSGCRRSNGRHRGR